MPTSSPLRMQADIPAMASRISLISLRCRCYAEWREAAIFSRLDPYIVPQ